MDPRILYINFLLMILFPPARTVDLGSDCNLPLGSACPFVDNSECDSHGKCVCRQPDYYLDNNSCKKSAPYGSICLTGRAQTECAIGLSCDYIQTNFGKYCVCATGQFGYQPHTGMCRNVTILRADNLHLNGPPDETELSIAWDGPLNVSDPLTYRMVINGTEEITPINATMYTLTNRHPGTRYLIQIYTSTFKDYSNITDVKIENNNPLQETFCTKPAVPGSLATNIYSNSSVTLQFFKSVGRVESYNVTVTANTSRESQSQPFTSVEVVGNLSTGTFHNLVSGELYDVTIKSISCGLESEGRLDYFITQPAIPGSIAMNTFSTPNVTLQFSKSEGRVERYNVTIIANSSGQSFTQLCPSDGATGVWRNVTFYNLDPDELYGVRIKAISWGVESEDKLDYFVIRAPCGPSCLIGGTRDGCTIGLTCESIHAGQCCVCPIGQFGYQPDTGMCRNVTILHADNLHVNGTPNETELSLAWDRPLNVSDPLTYRMEINGTENITSISRNRYTLTNRQPGTPYQIQIYTSTSKDSGVTEEKIENNIPLQGTFCTKPAVPGSLATNIYTNSSITLQFFRSDGRVESYNVTVTANPSIVAQNQFVTSVGDWINATFHNFVPGELYNVSIKAISCELESEERIDYLIIQPSIPGSLATNNFSNPNVTLQFSESEGRVERYNVTIIANSSGQSFAQLCPSDGATGVWRNVTFYNLDPGEFYDVRIKAISWGVESEDKLDYFVIRAPYGLGCLSGPTPAECSNGLSCDYKQDESEKLCVCPSGQFGYQPHSGMCRNVNILRADNLHLNGPLNETELSLAWDEPLNVSDPLTYRMEINGTENITSISINMYTLTNRQPGTPYQIQIYTSTFKDFGVTEEKIENNNPLQETFCTKPAAPGFLATNIYSNSSVTLQFFKSDGRVESYIVTVTANTSSVSQNKSITSDDVVGNWSTATFYNLLPGELYDVRIKAISCELESEERMDYFIIQPAIPGSLAMNIFSTNNVTLQFSESEGRVEKYNVTIIANSSEQSFTELCPSDGTTGVWRNVTFYNLDPGEYYDVRIKAISWGVESEEKLDYFVLRAPYGWSCLSGPTPAECSTGLSCDYIQANSEKLCVCPPGQFGYQPHTGLCRNVTILHADNLHLNGSLNETELSLAWDGPLNVSDPLTYRMEINGTENITSISTNMYTLTNRQPGTPYQIQIYTSTIKDSGVTEEKIENNNPLQGTFCTKPAVPGSLSTNIYSNSSATLQFFKSDGRVESYSVTVTSNTSRNSQNQSVKSDEVVGDWLNAALYNLVPGELYGVTIKAISCGLESEGRIDYFIIQPAVPGSLATNTFSTKNVTLQFSESEGRVERYNVTIIANSSGKSFTELCPSDGATGVWRNVTFYELEIGEFYDVRIKSISWGIESEDKLDYFVIRAPYGWICLTGPTPAECPIGLSCVYIKANLTTLCVCPSGQFGYQPKSETCQNVNILRADNLHLNGPLNETELSLAWDEPLNVSDPLTYRMEINGTENVTSISITMYTLTNRQPGTPYQIQIYTSTFKDFGVTEEKIENNNPLQGTFCTKPAVPGSLATSIYSNSSVTLQFSKSDGRVESYSVTITANTSSVSHNQSVTSDEVVGDWINVTFYNLVPGELYDVRIKAISCGLESEGRIDYFIIRPAIPGSIATNTFSTPNVTLQFSESEGRVERYNVTIIANSSGQSFTQLCPSEGATSVWRNVTFYNLEIGEFYDVRIKAISWGMESEDKLDYFVLRAPYGWSCLSGPTPAECSSGLRCELIQAESEKLCVCPPGQFGYQPQSGMCRNLTTLRADNLHLNGPPNETELSLAWDRPLNVSDPLTYRMEINGTDNITSISTNMYTLTDRQPGTPYQIQIYTFTFKDFGVTVENIENNNPLNGTFCTKPAVPGSLATNIYSNSSVTLEFFKSDGRVESYSVTATANSSKVSQNQSIISDGVVGDWRNATFSNLEPGELYDVIIKAISCGLESEGRIDYFIIQPAIPGSIAANTFSTNNVTLQFSESEGRVEKYNVTIIANSSGQSFSELCPSEGATGVWRNVTFYNLDPGEFYDVRIKAISWGMESEETLDYFVIMAPYGWSCLSGPTPAECPIGLSCDYIQTKSENVCVCPSGQFGYQPHTGMCRNETTLHADNLHLNEPRHETELSLAWDHPLNVSDPLTYRMVINGTEEITPINVTVYTLTNRQPGTPYLIQIYTSTFKDSGVTEEKIENNNPLQGTFCTKNSESPPPLPLGAILGGVAGALCFVAIVVIVIYRQRHRRNSHKGNLGETKLPEDILY